MKTILTLVVLVAIGFVASRRLFTETRLRLPITVVFLTGIEFFFLGVILGPNMLNLITVEVLEDLKPVIYLALGWAGLLFGVQMSRRHLGRLSRNVVRLTVQESVATSVVVSAVLFFVIRLALPEAANTEVVSAAVMLGITAGISSPTIVAVLSRVLPSRGKFTTMARITSSLSAVVPLLVFGFFFTVAHHGFMVQGRFLSGLIWWLFANFVGVAMGFVFVQLTLRRMARDERLLLIIGTTMFVGGICYLLSLSALYTSMVMGVVVANFSKRRVLIFEQLMSLEKTLYVAFLILLGTVVTVSGNLWMGIIAVCVVLRLILKLTLSGKLIRRNFPEFANLGPSVGLVYSAQGGMALAVAIDFGQGTQGGLVDVIVVVIAGCVVVNEFAGVVLTRRALAASGETQVRRAPGDRAVTR